MADLMDTKKLTFNEFPGFAAHLLSNHLEDYVSALTVSSFEEELPLMKLFSHLSHEELVAFGIGPHKEFLEVVVRNGLSEFIATSIKAYKEDKMEDFGRHDILVEDITKGSFIRSKVFRSFYHTYTDDQQKLAVLTDEIERFTAESNAATFAALMEIQMEKVNGVNEELTETKRELLELQELADMGSYIWNLTNDTSSFTPGVSKILGLKETVTNEEFMNRIHPEDRLSTETAIENALKGSGTFESEYRYIVNGEVKNVHSRGIVTFDNTGKAIKMKGTLTDTTIKQRLLNELQESEALNKQAQSITHIGNWRWHVESGKVYWSDEMYRIYGLEPQSEEITFERFIELIHPDDRQNRIEEIKESILKQKAKDYLLRIVNPDGTMKVLKGKGDVVISEGQVKMLVGTCQDITKEFKLNEDLMLKTKELEKLNTSLETKNTQLEQINKELESFTYVASHDLQEPLRKIQIFADRILETSSDQLTGNTAEYFTKILGSASRMRLLIDDLLRFSRSTSSEQHIEKVDLGILVNDTLSSFSQLIESKNAFFEIGELPVVDGTRFQLHQLFLNLIENSLKYSRPDVQPLIRISAKEISVSETEITGPYANFHEIKVSDNGVGFDPGNAKDIFGLFKRLHSKHEYDGTGIGLAICKKIADNHNGSISASGSPGKGAEFSICLPVRDTLMSENQ